MTTQPFSLWVYLSQSPLLWLSVTLSVYACADAFSLWTRRNPMANPVLHSMWILGLVLILTVTPYETYFRGAQFVHFLLGPATVALAVPLYENRKVVLSAIVPMIVALLAGSVTAITSVIWFGEAAGLPRSILLSLTPKSVTAAVAMGISETLGADPSLTAVAVILTGIMGAMIVTPLMNSLRIKDFRARELARLLQGLEKGNVLIVTRLDRKSPSKDDPWRRARAHRAKRAQREARVIPSHYHARAYPFSTDRRLFRPPFVCGSSDDPNRLEDAVCFMSASRSSNPSSSAASAGAPNVPRPAPS